MDEPEAALVEVLLARPVHSSKQLFKHTNQVQVEMDHRIRASNGMYNTQDFY